MYLKILKTFQMQFACTVWIIICTYLEKPCVLTTSLSLKTEKQIGFKLFFLFTFTDVANMRCYK